MSGYMPSKVSLCVCLVWTEIGPLGRRVNRSCPGCLNRSVLLTSVGPTHATTSVIDLKSNRTVRLKNRIISAGVDWLRKSKGGSQDHPRHRLLISSGIACLYRPGF